ncbi:radical SAM/SPASM domain-containing protein [Paenibacillus graminis]|uniref:Heme biosynthesis protein n=1 Tax=Paenibacillus graminis TaxID=189425 RepID=A0A089MF38_9BACL|nr:radical SAM/SPASM domain-containing protein [Paenibacillus graminis]AIQ70985.1 heme biosynthesis protein [Paenibacillus graminis]
MNVTIFFTRDCNLRCSYCYEGEKNTSEISHETLDRISCFVSEHMRKVGDHDLTIVTHGGEPLLVHTKIQSFIKQIKEKIPQTKFSITTNGTIMNDSILELLSEEYDNISISIDGTKEAHDKNRVYKNQLGSFELVKKNALRLLDKRPDTVARMTVNSSNVSDLYQGVMELIEMGFTNIMPTPDEFDSKWNEQSLEIFLTQCKRITAYLYSNKDLHSMPDVGFINDAPMKTRNSVCDGGIETLTIDVNGDIYPCIIVNGIKEFCIGSVLDGIDEKKLKMIHAEDHQEIEECIGCERYHYCTTTRCKIINKVKTGDFNLPSGTQCCIEHIFVQSALYSEEVIKAF